MADYSPKSATCRPRSKKSIAPGGIRGHPIWKRLALQAVGKNVESLPEYRTIYDKQIQGLMVEFETAQQRIAVLKPEAAIPKEMRPEYQELKEEVTRLGGTKKIRELLPQKKAPIDRRLSKTNASL